MKCHYCGKEVWLVRHLLDGDFCSPVHRKKYHERLRRSLEQLPHMDGPPAPTAGFRFEMPPMDSHGTGRQRSVGFLSSRFGVFPPLNALDLTPLFGQAFFGPGAATAAAPKAGVHSLTMLEPVISGPNVTPLGRSWTLAGDPALASRDRLLPVGAVHVDAGAPALPLCSPPVALVARAPQVMGPKLALRGIFGDGFTGDAAFSLPKAPLGDLRHVPLAAWTRANLEPVWKAGRTAGTAEALPRAVAAIATRNGSALQLPHCAPGNFPAPLLAKDTVAAGKMSSAYIQTDPIERRADTHLPIFHAAATARLVPEDKAIWKIDAAAPWNLSQQTVAVPIAAGPSDAVLPAMVLSPVRPGLAAESEIRPVAAQALEMPATASHQQRAAIEAVERPAAPPPIAVPAFAPALPGAFAPHLLHNNVCVQEHAAVPSTAAEMPLGVASRASDPLLERTLAPCLGTRAAAAELRPEAAQWIASGMPAFVPQAAVPRCSAEFVARGPRRTTAIPGVTSAGFAWTPFAAMAPEPLERRLRPLAPQAAPLTGSRMSLGEPAIAITGIGLPEPLDVLPLDVYVQRVRSTPKRECAWKDPGVYVVQSTALPGVWPARFEQLVLQDWRRRYPARQVAVAPAPIGTGTKVLPIARHLSAFARLRQNAPHFVKGVAAAAVVGAILWLSWSTETVKSTVTADRHWLHDAISRRATLIHDDNFHSGLNLWEGRKNWANSWSHSADGFMRTGQLALYRPTLKMENYRLEFFTQIESKSVGWVFRAKDERNYYAMKLSVTEPGPRPLVSVVRYPVLDGRKGKRVQIPLPIMMHNNTPYHVALDVKGTRFRAFVEDQEVDSWNDDRLRSGGVGFFSEAGEHARLYWVKVSNNTDWLGRLCGILAGGKTQDAADLWNPADPDGSMAALDPGGILDGAKNVDRRRGVPTLPFAAVFLGNW